MASKKTTAEQYFTRQLLSWHRTGNTRNLPWTGEKDPYKVWLREIMLQQTRVEQGSDYYNHFVETFPRISDLARADEHKIYKMWEGLGYYTRCKNLIDTAKFIDGQLGGIFPDSYDEILALKGIGPYTAAAIASFAFGLPYAVLDGNVFRVLSRYFGLSVPINDHAGKKLYGQQAQKLLSEEFAGEYNQAIMDFGATICKPKNPLCHTCVMKTKCVAFAENRVEDLPVNTKKIRLKKRYFDYIIFEFQNQILIQTRTGKDIWENLNEFFLLEQHEVIAESEVMQQIMKAFNLAEKDFQILSVSSAYKQRLTHQLIEGRFFHMSLNKKINSHKNYRWEEKSNLKSLAFPKLITHYINEKETIFNLITQKKRDKVY